MFAVFVGIIAVLNLAISCYQAALGQKQLDLAHQSFSFQNGGSH